MSDKATIAKLVSQILHTIKPERIKLWGEDASEEHDAELARQLLTALRARVSYSFGKTQEFISEELEHSLR